MKKLCLAVIILSFFGFGPLKSLFHSKITANGDALVKKITESSGLSTARNNNKAMNYLILEGNENKGIKQTGFAMLLKQEENNKWAYEPISIPIEKNLNGIASIKKAIKKTDDIAIDHCFIIDFSGMARIIDLLAPNGIQLTKLKNGPQENGTHILHGKEIVALIDSLPSNAAKEKEISVIFSSLKKEAAKNFSAEEMITLAPAVINEAMRSVKTDLSKGELISLGITAILNPVNQSGATERKAITKTTNPVKLDPKQLPILN